MNHDVMVWEFEQDYPGLGGADDSVLPIGRVLVKAADGAYFQGTFDHHGAAVQSYGAMERLRTDVYGPHGIYMAAWAVPHGVFPGSGPWPQSEGPTYAYREGAMHGTLARLAAGEGEPVVLTLDLEPYYYDNIAGEPQYWRKDIGAGPNEVRQYLDGAQAAGVQHVDISVVARRNAEALRDVDYLAWISHPIVSRVLPQVYWPAFQAGVDDAFEELSTGLMRIGGGWPVERIRPVFRGDATPDEIAHGWDRALRHGFDRPIFFRRGVVSPEAWEMMRGLDWHPPQPSPPPLDVPAALADLGIAQAHLRRAMATLGAT